MWGRGERDRERAFERAQACLCMCVCVHVAGTGKGQVKGMVREITLGCFPSITLLGSKCLKVSIWRPGTGQSHLPIPFCPREAVGSPSPSPPLKHHWPY